jgi:hypothetical protein
MSRDTTVIRLRQPDAIDDPLTEVARDGARRMLATVLIAEADAFVALWKDVKLPDGRAVQSAREYAIGLWRATSDKRRTVDTDQCARSDDRLDSNRVRSPHSSASPIIQIQTTEAQLNMKGEQ